MTKMYILLCEGIHSLLDKDFLIFDQEYKQGE